MENKEDIKRILEAIKIVMKAKKLKYIDLAESMNMSESGVKKLFNSYNISLSRLLDVCEIIDLPLEDVVKRSKDFDSYKLEWTRDQKDLFMEDGNYLLLYWEIYLEQKDFGRILKDHSLDRQQLTKYMLNMDRVGLLEFHGNDHIKANEKEHLKFPLHDSYTKNLLGRFSHSLVNESIENCLHTDYIFHFKYSPMSMDLFREMKIEVNKVLQEYTKRGHYESSTNKSNVECFRILFSGAEGSPVVPGDIK